MSGSLRAINPSLFGRANRTAISASRRFRSASSVDIIKSTRISGCFSISFGNCGANTAETIVSVVDIRIGKARRSEFSEKAKRAIWYGILGMALAVGATMGAKGVGNFGLIAAMVAVGGVAGWFVANRFGKVTHQVGHRNLYGIFALAPHPAVIHPCPPALVRPGVKVEIESRSQRTVLMYVKQANIGVVAVELADL